MCIQVYTYPSLLFTKQAFRHCMNDAAVIIRAAFAYLLAFVFLAYFPKPPSTFQEDGSGGTPYHLAGSKSLTFFWHVFEVSRKKHPSLLSYTKRTPPKRCTRLVVPAATPLLAIVLFHLDPRVTETKTTPSIRYHRAELKK